MKEPDPTDPYAPKEGQFKKEEPKKPSTSGNSFWDSQPDNKQNSGNQAWESSGDRKKDDKFGDFGNFDNFGNSNQPQGGKAFDLNDLMFAGESKKKQEAADLLNVDLIGAAQPIQQKPQQPTQAPALSTLLFGNDT